MARRGAGGTQYRVRAAGCYGLCVLLVSGCASAVVRDTDDSLAQVRPSKAALQRDMQRISQQTTTIVEGQSFASIAPWEANAPATIRTLENTVPWPMPLAEAIDLALRNNPIVRQNAQFLAPLGDPQQTPSIFDPELQYSDTQFGSRGEEAARGDFDPRLTLGLGFGRELVVQNNQFLGGGLLPGSTLVSDANSFNARLEQPLWTGGTFALAHEWDYSQTNQPNLLFPSAYSGNLGVELRQPLLAGAGVDFAEIAGPASARSRGGPLTQGIRIAQINQRISAVDFDLALRLLVRDVHQVYWQLSAAQAAHAAEIEVRDASERVWKEMAANREALGGAIIAQAEQTYFEAQSRVEGALAEVYETETRLRRLISLPPADGRVIRSASPPSPSPPHIDWRSALAEALQSRPELQRQKLQLASLEFQRTAAVSLTKPQLDFVGGYRLNGFGDKLINRNRNDGITDDGYRSAYGTLFDGKQSGWNVGLQFSLPIGLRTEWAQVRNTELRLAKARATLASTEQELGHEVAVAVQNVDRWYQLQQTNFARRAAAERQTRALEAEYQAGRADRNTVDLLLRARQSQAQATIEHARSLANYQAAHAELAYRTGRLLRDHHVTLISSAHEPLHPKSGLEP